VKYRVIVEPPARANLDEAYLWIAERNPAAAIKWFNGLEAAIRTLEDFPQRWPLAEESKVFEVEIRQLIYGKRVGAYRVLFTIEGESVHVLHVRHGRRRRLRRAPRRRR
jgi:plasmid stabilization system protein ParE